VIFLGVGALCCLLTLFDGRKDIRGAHEELCHLFPKMFFQNKWRKKGRKQRGDLLTEVHLENGH